MAKNFRRMFAMVMVLCMILSALPMQALATEDDGTSEPPAAETPTTVDNGDGTSTTTTITETPSSESENITVVVQVESKTDNATGEVLTHTTTEQKVENITSGSSDSKTGEETPASEGGTPTTNEPVVLKETVVENDYQEENFEENKDTTDNELAPTDVPEVSAKLEEKTNKANTTTGSVYAFDAEEVGKSEDGTNLIVTPVERQLSVTVEKNGIQTTTDKELHDKVDSYVDTKSKEIVTNTEGVIGNDEGERVGAVAKTLDKVTNIAQNGYMSSASDLDALKEQIKASDGEATENIDDVLAELDEEKALAITQAAMKDTANGNTESESAYDEGSAEDLLYDYLMGAGSEGTPEKTEQVMKIDEKSLKLNIGDKIGETTTTVTENAAAEPTSTTANNIYEGSLNFSLTVIPTENDDLLVCLQYKDADGVTQTVTKRLAGQNSPDQNYESITAAEDGSYTIGGLKLSENSNQKFDLKLEGLQTLEDSLYLYSDGETAQGTSTDGESKEMQVVSERREVNTTTSVSFKYDMKTDTKVKVEVTVPHDQKTATQEESGIDFNLYNYGGKINLVDPDDTDTKTLLSKYLNFNGGGSGTYGTGTKDPGQLGNGHLTYERNLVNGAPVVTWASVGNLEGLESSEARNIGYLFGMDEHFAVTAYQDILNTPLTYDPETGYYTYDSSKNAVDFDMDENWLYVRGFLERTTASAGSNYYFGENDGLADFLPFNSRIQMEDGKITSFIYDADKFLAKDGETNYHHKGTASGNSEGLQNADYWFGASMSAEFYYPKDGQ